ncbi:MAG: MGMT family protein [Dokdonella sp.]
MSNTTTIRQRAAVIGYDTRRAAFAAGYAYAHGTCCSIRSIAIPCHRVVRNDGALSGYRLDIERKRALLAREAEYA